MMNNLDGYILSHVYDVRPNLNICGKCGCDRSAHFEIPDEDEKNEDNPELI